MVLKSADYSVSIINQGYVDVLDSFPFSRVAISSEIIALYHWIFPLFCLVL